MHRVGEVCPYCHGDFLHAHPLGRGRQVAAIGVCGRARAAARVFPHLTVLARGACGVADCHR